MLQCDADGEVTASPVGAMSMRTDGEVTAAPSALVYMRAGR